MRGHTPLAVAAALLLMPAVASAQVRGAAQAPGIHITTPAPKPEPPGRPSSVPRPTPLPHVRPDQGFDPAPGTDLFLARPGTYRPRPDRFPHYPYYPGAGFYPSGYPLSEVFVEPIVIERPVVVERTTVVEVEKEPEREIRATPPPRPAKPKTLYVIPRCYAGDKPPLAEQLPAGCDVANIKKIPPSS